MAASVAFEFPVNGESEARPDRQSATECILQLYRELLAREPQSAEREDWITALLNGTSPAEARAAFLASPEYQERRRNESLREAISASGLFDVEWYGRTYPDVIAAGVDPLEHYCRHGRFEARRPNAYFDEAWYRRDFTVPDDVPALLDYQQRGEQLGRSPGRHFDPRWYRDAYAIPADVSPLTHFLQHRRLGGVAPCPQLWCVAQRPAAAPAGDPFEPYLTPDWDPQQAATADIALLHDAALFDENYYQIVNNDVFSATIEPLTHFCAFGWREERNPNFYFHTSWYMVTNPEVMQLAVNPLVHYLLIGEPAGRRPVPYFEPDWYRRHYDLPPKVSPLAHYLANRRNQNVSPNSLFDVQWYLAHCGEKLHHRRDAFAHYLVAGMSRDLQPSPQFDAAAWRRRTHGRPTRHFRYSQRPERDNPLVNYMLAQYR